MPKIAIDGVEYNTEDLSENGKAQVASLQFIEAQMMKLQNEIAAFKTARAAYARALNEELNKKQ